MMANGDALQKRTVYECEEFGAVNIPTEALLRNGRLDIYHEVTHKSFFTVDYLGTQLRLRAGRFVGLIPISDTIAINVKPRVPIARILHMASRANTGIQTIRGFSRYYDLDNNALPEELFAEIFATAVELVLAKGLQKKYIKADYPRPWRGRLLGSATIKSRMAGQYSQYPVFEETRYTADCAENRVLSETCRQLAQLLTNHPNKNLRPTATRLWQAQRIFSSMMVREPYPREWVNIPSLAASLHPRFYYYSDALWMSYLIFSKKGISIDKTSDVTCQVFVVNTPDMFEGYVRVVLSEGLAGCEIFDGNQSPVRLFADLHTAIAKPDIYIQCDGVFRLVLDVKYKNSPTAEDHYELLGFCEALQIERAAFVLPSLDGVFRCLPYAKTRSGKMIWIIRLPLLCDEGLDAELVQSVARLIEM